MAGAAEGSYRSVLRLRDFRLLTLGSAASQIGDWLYNVALLVYVFDRTHSATWVAAATMVRLLPFVVLGPVGGVIADRYERTRILVASTAVQTAVMVGMTAAVAWHAQALVVIVLAGANSASAVAVRPAALAMVPPVVGESGLAPANALLHTVQDVGVVAGPAIGAGILALGSPSLAFGANAATFVVAGLTFALLRVRSRGAGESAAGPVAQFVDGLRAVRDTPYVPILTLITFIGAFTYGAQTVQLVVYAQERLGLSSDGYGYLLASAGFGGVLGATVSNRLASRRRIAVPLTVGIVVFVGSQLGFAGVSVAGVAIAIGVASGLGMVAADVIAETAISRTASNEVMGRIFGAYDGISVGAMVLGAFVAAPLVKSTGIRTSLVILGCAAIGVALLCVPTLVGLDRVSARVVEVLEPRIEVLSKLAIFTGATRFALERLASAADEVSVASGTVVIAEGDPADDFYVCTDGTLDVFARGEFAGPARHLRTLGPGAHFGEIGLIEHIPRTATVRATTDCSLLRIPGGAFLDALTTAPAGLSTMRDGVRIALARTHPSMRPRGADELLAQSEG